MKRLVLTDYLSESATELQQQADGWEEAVRRAGGLLERQGYILPAYTQAMVDMVKELGPYIVIMPGVALAHARPEGNVKRNSIALVTFRQGVPFGNESNDPVYAVFAIAATSDQEHLELFRTLAKFIAEEENVERLKTARTYEEIGL